MELDRALELAVLASWEDLVEPGDTCCVRVEYEKQPDSPLSSVAVWTVTNRGYETLVCSYSISPSDSASGSFEGLSIQFTNSYGSKTLADSLGFVMRNQNSFSRPTDRSIHGLVQVDCPSKENRSEAASWNRSIRAEFAGIVWN